MRQIFSDHSKIYMILVIVRKRQEWILDGFIHDEILGISLEEKFI